MDFRIRTAGPSEYAALGDLTVQAYLQDGLLDEGDPYVQRLRDAASRTDGAELLAAVDGDGTLLGTVTYVAGTGPWAEISRPGEAEFRMLGVAGAARGRGVGEALVRACATRARAAHRRALVLSTATSMHTAHRLYDRLGFSRLPERDWDPVPGVHLLAYGLKL